MRVNKEVGGFIKHLDQFCKSQVKMLDSQVREHQVSRYAKIKAESKEE